MHVVILNIYILQYPILDSTTYHGNLMVTITLLVFISIFETNIIQPWVVSIYRRSILKSNHKVMFIYFVDVCLFKDCSWLVVISDILVHHDPYYHNVIAKAVFIWALLRRPVGTNRWKIPYLRLWVSLTWWNHIFKHTMSATDYNKLSVLARFV